MAGRVRKGALALHLASSVGWIGALVAYLALAVASLERSDETTVRSAYIAMHILARAALVPLAGAAFLTGLAMALGTPWGLFRHWWVLLSLVLTAFALLVLLLQLPQVAHLAEAARDPTVPGEALPGPEGQVLHAAGGLAVLLVVQVLNVAKPRGLTRYGWRKEREERAAARP